MAKSLDDVFDLFVPDRPSGPGEPPRRTPAAADFHRDPETVLAVPIEDDDLTRANLAWNLAASIARLGRRIVLFCHDKGALWPRAAPPRGLRCLCVGSRSDPWVAGRIAALPHDLRLVALPWARLSGIATAGAAPASLLIFTSGARPTSALATRHLAALRRVAPSLRVMEVATRRAPGPAEGDSTAGLSGLDDLRSPLGARGSLEPNTSLGRELASLSARILAP
ncbi:MAG: hypothetical protein HKP27_03965 [Myxococcales bacterium]|nr:hypothetical protein [Myxococcales bacterium]